MEAERLALYTSYIRFFLHLLILLFLLAMAFFFLKVSAPLFLVAIIAALVLLDLARAWRDWKRVKNAQRISIKEGKIAVDGIVWENVEAAWKRDVVFGAYVEVRAGEEVLELPKHYAPLLLLYGYDVKDIRKLLLPPKESLFLLFLFFLTSTILWLLFLLGMLSFALLSLSSG